MAWLPQNMELRILFKQISPSVKHSFYITFAVTIISLGSVVYMLQVYDRVVSTRSMGTLLSLTIAVVFAYAVAELLEMVRKKLLQRSTLLLETDLSERVFRAIHRGTLMNVQGIHVQQMKDLGMLRDFLHSPGFMGLLELPTALFFLLLIFVINPQMGYFSILGLLVQGGITFINATKVDPALRKAQNSAIEAMYYCFEIMRNSQVMHALGMSRNMENLWLARQKRMMAEQAKASDTAGFVMSASKFIGLTQGSLMLGLGCLLTIYGLMAGGGGMLIVASIIGGKALQPIMQLLSSWKPLTEARMALERIETLMSRIPADYVGVPLPPPQGNLSVEHLVVAAPGQPFNILRGMSFSLAKGNVLAVMGPNAAGKSTLTRALLGIWPSSGGKVRLDGADIFQWNKDHLGQFIGYLPQDVDLFDGTVADNISRFAKEPDLAQIEEICKLINIHDVITALPNGYLTDVGDEGVTFSGGQRQRIGLARALYGYPNYIIMDEPNSNLDQENEQFLINAIRHMKARGATQILVTHRQSLVNEADFLMVVQAGTIARYGTREEVLAALRPPTAGDAQEAPEVIAAT